MVSTHDLRVLISYLTREPGPSRLTFGNILGERSYLKHHTLTQLNIRSDHNYLKGEQLPVHACLRYTGLLLDTHTAALISVIATGGQVDAL